MALRHNTVIVSSFLKDPSQPSLLLILHGEAKSCCFTVSCVPESMSLYSDFLYFDMLQIKHGSQTLVCKQKQSLGYLCCTLPPLFPNQYPFIHLGEERHYESTNTMQ